VVGSTGNNLTWKKRSIPTWNNNEPSLDTEAKHGHTLSMKSDTVTLVLSGDVPLGSFARAIARFHSLILGLSVDAGSPELEWVIDDLERSSTIATARGIGAPDRIAAVVRAYEGVGEDLAAGKLMDRYSRRVRRAALGLRAIAGGKIEAVRFETAAREAIIRRASDSTGRQPVASASRDLVAPVSQTAYGAIEGRVQTLSNRGGLRFTLFDLLHDRAVSCYLKEGYEEIMRNAWGRVAAVAGWISRDLETGRPTTIRQVTTVRIRPEPSGTFRDARGALSSVTGELPEHVIRRLRDA
jgi:hypothetical protein